MRALRAVAGSVLGLAVAAGPMFVSAPASAAPASSAAAAAAVAPCLTGVATTLQTASQDKPPVPRWRQNADTTPVTSSDLDALPVEMTRRSFIAQEVEPELASRVTVPTYVHVIKGTHRGERTPTGPKRVRRMISTLNQGMAGDQSDLSAPTRYQFSLKKISYTKRDGWYHAYNFGPRDTRAKRALHRGNAGALNVYVNGGGSRDYPVLGWASFPWQYDRAPFRDAVSVTTAALPGGRATGYNLGDTVIHETGHWLGLFHTFQGGCGSEGDMVSDTAAEGEPSYDCETTRDTCTAPGLDPVRNFMDYSLDSCMNMLTSGQVRRIDSAFEKYRS